MDELVNDMPEEKESVDLQYEFLPNNPYTLSIDAKGLGQSHAIEGDIEKPSFFKTAVAEASEFNSPLTWAYHKAQGLSTLDDIAPPDWNPTSDPSKFAGVSRQFIPYLYDATGPKDLEYRLQRVKSEQEHSETLANGSFAAKVVGGLVGIATDPLTYIPLISMAKYAKLGASVLKNAQRTAPGIFAYSAMESAAKQSDRINGNLKDFFTDTAINTIFATSIFAGLGAASYGIEKMNLWNMRKVAKEYIDGIDFKMVVDEKGKNIGLKAYDAVGGLSADKVSIAQSYADAEFAKTGFFKIPYLGKGLYHLMTAPYIGTPLPKLLNSKSDVMKTFVDRIVDHNILTKGLLEGKTSPIKFQTLMDQELANLRVTHAQMETLLAEERGFDLQARPLVGAANFYSDVYTKSAEMLGQDLAQKKYLSRFEFYDKTEDVLISNQQSELSGVNTAAGMIRQIYDDTYLNYRKAHNLPEDWLPPRTAENYSSIVYDTPHLNTHETGEKGFIPVISEELKRQDAIIEQRMAPINDLIKQIEIKKIEHEAMIRGANRTDAEIKASVREIDALKRRQRVLEEKLQNELRSDPDLNLMVENHNHLSSNEVAELKELTKRRDIAQKEIDAQKKLIASMKKQSTTRKASAMKAKTVKTGKKKLRESDTGVLLLQEQENKLHILEKELDEEIEKIQDKIAEGKVNPRLYYKEKGSERFTLRDPSERLKLRKQYESHFHREQHAKQYYNTIMNQTSEDTVNDIMGRLTGSVTENPLMARSILVPHKLLKDNGFLSKDLMAKVGNYVSYFARKTHIKTIFNDVDVNGGIEPLLAQRAIEHENIRIPLNEKKVELQNKLSKAETAQEKKDIQKSLAKIDKLLVTNRKEFEKDKEIMGHLYKKMMGINTMSRTAKQAQRIIMSFTAMASLGFVPFTMINDLSAAGLQHGIWPFIRDGVYPIAQSFGGILKTKDSEALRRTAPSVHLAFQDVLNSYAHKNWDMYTNPYVNLGKWVSGMEKLAQFSANITLTNYFDNGLQRIAGSIVQSEFMRILHAYQKGTMLEKEGLYLRKYGIDPEKWADRMTAAFKANGGGKTKVGGYQSLFWKWEDLEASNQFADAVFRGIQSTVIKRGLADSPFWTDNFLGSLIHGFKGWTYASLNRYVIPSMQQPDAQKLMGVMFMLATGYFVSPLRRLARGEEMFPETQTDKQRLFETIQDSGYFSWFLNVLSDANIASSNRLLNEYRSDRYMDRTRVGLIGPAFGTANRLFDIMGAVTTNEMNQADLKKAFRMIPMFNSTWGAGMSIKLAESEFLNLPRTRAEARTLKGD